jgi:hypothetical protein
LSWRRHTAILGFLVLSHFACCGQIDRADDPGKCAYSPTIPSSGPLISSR